MKAKTIISSVVLSFAAIASAQAGSWDASSNAPFKGVYGHTEQSLSRAQVQAELRQARAAGQVSIGDTDNVAFDGVYGDSARSVDRALVQGELQQARAAGSPGNGDLNNEPFQGA